MTRYAVAHRQVPFVDPEAAFVALFASEPTAFWLDSSDAARGGVSFMGGALGPLGFVVSYRVAEKAVRIRAPGGETVARVTDFLSWLDGAIAERRIANAHALPFDFTGGFCGYLGYELKAETGGAARHVAPHPDAQLVFADRVLAFDPIAGTVTLVALVADGAHADADTWLDATAARLDAVRRAPSPPLSLPTHERIVLRWSRGRARYLEDIRVCQERLTDGETYEVCLTDTLRARTNVSPLDFHRRLRARNPAPYAAFLRFEGLAIASASPECFLAIGRDGSVETQPIKGTAPRGTTPEEDARIVARLASSEKTRSENLMVVDLLRNDLGVVCAIGSVAVPRLMHVESYATVHQLVSTIRGRLRDGVGAVGCVRAAFPGGSMTGAPKVRTMQVLDALETEARGIYSGALGYFSTSGAAKLSIVIRTAVFAAGEVAMGAGGAITALSDAAEEHDEIVLKTEALVATLRACAGEDLQTTSTYVQTARASERDLARSSADPEC